VTGARPAWFGAAIILIAASLFGSLGIASRFAYDAGIEPFAFVAWRAAIGAVGLWLGILAVRRPAAVLAGFRRLGASGRRWLAFGVVMSAALNLAAFLAFDNTTVALALLGFYTYPALVAGASVLLGRERLDAMRVVALALSLGGMAAVVLGGEGAVVAPGDNTLGIVLALTAAGCQTAFILSSRAYAALAADKAMGAILAGTAVLSIGLCLVTVGPAALLMPLGSPALLLGLAFVGLFAAALPSVLFLTGIRIVGGVRSGILMLFEPVVGVALAAAFLEERLAPAQFVGGLTILLAAVLVQRSGSRSGTGIETPAVLPAPGGP
jgi:drug/metabolite transporter, DME family